ncbi:MAG: hypothetical protein NTV05_08120 [Acidobacteria bacterium]|nr:hypothetical protein [Acidobacteriota bacterium]
MFKFFSGAAFAGTIANAYLFLYDVSVPFPLFGFTISPRLVAVKAVVSVVLCGVFFYFGYLQPRQQSR